MTDTPEENIWDGPEVELTENEDSTQVGRHSPPEDEEQDNGPDNDLRELRDQLAEAQADLANHRKRKRRDLDDQYEAGRGEVITNLIPVLDSILGAQEHGDLTDDNPLTPVLRSLSHTLEALGLGAIGEVGEDFDPNVHEAMKVDFDEAAEGTKVSQVHQRGYATPERLLRPALVTVTKRPKPTHE